MGQWPRWLSAVAPRTHARRGRSASSLVSPLSASSLVSLLLSVEKRSAPRPKKKQPHNPTQAQAQPCPSLLIPTPVTGIRCHLTPPQPLFERLPHTFPLLPHTSKTATAPPPPKSSMTATAPRPPHSSRPQPPHSSVPLPPPLLVPFPQRLLAPLPHRWRPLPLAARWTRKAWRPR